MKKQINLKKLKKSEKAVLIAKDVLKWIKEKRIVASQGTYVLFSENIYNRQGEQLQAVLSEAVTPEKPCTVCALGACFLASVDRFNALEIPYAYGTGGWQESGASNTKICFNPLQEHLHQAFSTVQLMLIESAFEGRVMTREHENLGHVGPQRISEKLQARAVAFGQQKRFFEESIFGYPRPEPEKVLIGICRNIIKNDGVFVP